MQSTTGGTPTDALGMKNKQKPAHEVRIGSIKAALWKNDTDNGVRYNATFSRLYKDGENWQSTDSFGRDDLLLLGKVANEAHTWICSQAQESGAASRGRQNGEDDR